MVRSARVQFGAVILATAFPKEGAKGVCAVLPSFILITLILAIYMVDYATRRAM